MNAKQEPSLWPNIIFTIICVVLLGAVALGFYFGQESPTNEKRLEILKVGYKIGYIQGQTDYAENKIIVEKKQEWTATQPVNYYTDVLEAIFRVADERK